MFEWGSGGSTCFFSQKVSFYRSIEHNKEWFNKTKDSIKDRINIDLQYFSPKFEYVRYINAITKFDDVYDAILVDGRCRVKCAKMAKDFLKKDGILFVHDYFKRPYYKDIENVYTLIDSIKNTPQTLAVFKNT